MLLIVGIPFFQSMNNVYEKNWYEKCRGNARDRFFLAVDMPPPQFIQSNPINITRVSAFRPEKSR